MGLFKCYYWIWYIPFIKFKNQSLLQVEMSPFELYQQMKPQIYRDEAVMANLKTYAFNQNTNLAHLGSGTTNTHYRVGRVGEIWLATREYFHIIGDPEYQKDCCETYIRRLLSNRMQGRDVPRIVGGVRAVAAHIRNETDTIDRYFLLVEDLTAGGSADFSPGTKGSWFGKVKGRGLVFYDFPEYTESSPDFFKYMTEEDMIKLER